MRILRILGVAALGLFVMAQAAMSQRGGAVRSGVRGAAVGQMVGGSEGAEKGAKIGVVTGATRTAIDRETTARTQYQTTAEYQNAPRSNFNEAPPEVLGAAAAGKATKPSGEAVIRKDDKPLVGITFPADWKQKTGDHYDFGRQRGWASLRDARHPRRVLTRQKPASRRSRQGSRPT